MFTYSSIFCLHIRLVLHKITGCHCALLFEIPPPSICFLSMSLYYSTTSTINAANRSINTVLKHMYRALPQNSSWLYRMLSVLSWCVSRPGGRQTWEIVTQSNWFNQSKRCAALLYPPDWTLEPEPQYPRSPALLWASAVSYPPGALLKSALISAFSPCNTPPFFPRQLIYICGVRQVGANWLFIYFYFSQAKLMLCYGFPIAVS